MARRLGMLVLQPIAVIALYALALSPTMGEGIRLIATSLLVLLVPGWLVGTCLIANDSIGRWERLILTLGLSFAIVILVSLGLNNTPWGLTRDSWLAAITIVSGLALALQSIRGDMGTARSSHSRAVGITIPQVLVLVLATLLVLLSVQVARIGVVRQPYKAFTQMWMLPANNLADETVRIGVRNVEGHAISYRLELLSGGRVLMELPDLLLNNGEYWENELPIPKSGLEDERLEARLFNASDPDVVYRHTALAGVHAR